MKKHRWLALIISVWAIAGLNTTLATTSPNTTDRQAIVVTAQERDHIIEEMHNFLSNVQLITQGIAANNMEQVMQAARAAGHSQPKPPMSLRMKLPPEFKKLGASTHGQFDTIALDAKALGDPNHSLEQLAEVLKNCVACHKQFSLELNHSQTP